MEHGRVQAPEAHYGRHLSASSLSTIANALVGIWLARFLAHELGLAGYAVVAMATALTMALTVFTSSANGAVSRFLTEALARSDDAQAERVFSSALLGMTALVVALAPAIWLASLYSPAILGVSEEPDLTRAYTLLSLSAAAVLSVVTVFTSSPFAVGRFDLLSGLQTSQALVRAASVAALVLLWEPTVRSVGAGTLVSAIGALGAAVLVWRRLTPQIGIRAGAVSWRTLGQMTSMGLWFGVDVAGTLLFYGLSTFLLGSLVGVASAASYGLYLSVVSCVGALGGALVGPVQPGIYSACARGDREEAIRLLGSSTRVSLAALALLSAGIVGTRLGLVSLWLGGGFEAVADALAVGLPPFAFAIALSPCLAMLNARDRTSWIATATIGSGVGHLVTCLVIYALGGLDTVMVALSAGVWLVGKMLALLWLALDDARRAARISLRLAGHFAVLLAPPLAAAAAVAGAVDLPALGETLLVGLAATAAWGIFALWAVRPGDVDYLLGRAWRATPLGGAYLKAQARRAGRSVRRQSTYSRFRRLPGQFDAICGPGLDLLLSHKRTGPLRLLVVGCASGAEPYSLVAELRRCRPHLAVEVLGVDVEPGQIARAKMGIYAADEVLAGAQADDFVRRVFETLPDGGLRVRDELRRAVTFEVADVLSPSFERDIARRGGGWDVVAAQNFLIHMPAATASRAFRNVVGAMAPTCLLLLDGVDLDLKVRLTREASLEPLSFLIREIHEQNERRASWGDHYVGLEPFDETRPDHSRRYATVYVRGPECVPGPDSPVSRALSSAEARA